MGDKEAIKKNKMPIPQGLIARGTIFVDAFIKLRGGVLKKLADFDSGKQDNVSNTKKNG